MGVNKHKLIMSSKLLTATLSSVLRVFSDVLFIIPLRAATISGPFMKSGIPKRFRVL